MSNPATPDATRFVPPRPYYYLWHLVALGIIKADFEQESPGGAVKLDSPTITGTVWDSIADAYPGDHAPAKVALIDIGVARSHPNLANRVDPDLSIDLVSHPFGAKAMPADGAGPFDREGSAAFFAGMSTAGLGALGLTPAEDAYLQSLVATLSASRGAVRTLVNNDQVFASHGTAVAGLVVGEPAVHTGPQATLPVATETLPTTGDIAVPNPDHNLLPYFGADPFSRLISIQTAFEQDANHFISAFLYAWKCDVDVILMPRGIPDPLRAIIDPKPELSQNLDDPRNWERADLFARLEEATPPETELHPYAVGRKAPSQLAWAVLEKLIIAISRKVPIVCAAGNDGESQLIYPAKLARPGNGIIAVGAVTMHGFRSGYSNYGEGLTLVAPSDDSEIYTRHQLRVDRTNPQIDQHYYYAGGGIEVPHSEFSLLTTDIPGAFGYSGGDEPYSMIMPPLQNPGIGGGYYTAFGGTSGASALVAGVAALVARANKARHGNAARLNGPDSKAILVAACDPNSAVKPGTSPLKADPMNADDEPGKGKSYFFGAGLLNAARAVAAVFAP